MTRIGRAIPCAAALGFGEQRMQGSLRFGLGRGNDQKQLAAAVELVAKRMEQLRRLV